MRKNLFKLFYSLIISTLLLVSSVRSFANHIVGVDLNYSWDSGNTYKITLVVYGNCGSESETTAYDSLYDAYPEICIYRGNTQVNSINLSIQAPVGVEITPVCPADSLNTQCHNLASTTPGIRKFIYSGYYTVPSQYAAWRFVFDGNMGNSVAGRATSISNISSVPDTYIQLIDTLNNTFSDHHNSSPILTVLPTPFFCDENSDNYNPGAVDPDGDSLSFFLVPGWSGSAACSPISTDLVTYNPGYSATAPFTTSSFSFNQATGQISFFPTLLQRSLAVYNIEEYRHGNVADTLVGTSQREMTFLVLTCTNIAPTASIDTAAESSTGDGVVDDSTHYHICANSGPFSLTLLPHEPDTSNRITVTATGIPTGATLTITGNGTNSPQVVFAWTSTGVAFGNYTFYLTYTDNNCPLSGQQTLAYTIGIYPIPTITANIASPATCVADATVNLIPGGLGQPWSMVTSAGVTLVADDSVAITHPFAPGTDTVYIYTAISTQCNGSVIFTIDTPSITATGAYTSQSYCGNNDGLITLSGLPAGTLDTVSYQLNGVTQPTVALTASPSGVLALGSLCAGTYSVITVHYGNCASPVVGPYTLDTTYGLISFTSTNPTACGFPNGVITISGLHPNQTDTVNYTKLVAGVAVPQPPAVNYVGPSGTLLISGLLAGVYDNIVVTTGGICNLVPPCVSDTIGPVALIAPGISAGFDSSIHYGCSGDTVIFSNLSAAPGSPAIYYTWYFGDGSSDTSANPTHVYLSDTGSVYTVTLAVTNLECKDTATASISLDNFITASFTTTSSYACQNTPVMFSNTSSGTSPTYTWYFGDGFSSSATDPTHIYPYTGNYNVMLVASNFVPCFDTAIETLAVDSNTSISLGITDTTLCEGQVVTLTGYYSQLGITNVLWTFGDGYTEQNVNPVVHAYGTSGPFTASVQVDYRACPDKTISDKINVFATPVINLGHDTSICPGGTAIILIDSNNENNESAKWLWNTGATTAAITVNTPGYYYATVSINGCSASDTVWVQNDCYMDIPNVFTPNGDGTNDYFYPRQYLTKGLTAFKMDIYNRWGQNVFETTSLDGRGWDGNFNNTLQPQGVYIYVIDGTFIDGQKEHHQGNITLLR